VRHKTAVFERESPAGVRAGSGGRSRVPREDCGLPQASGHIPVACLVEQLKSQWRVMSTVMSPIKEDDQLLVQDDQSKALYVSTHPNSVRAKASAAASARAPSNLALFHFNGASFTRSPRGLLHTILAPSPHTSYCISTLFYFLYFLLVCLVIFLCFFAGLDPLSSTWPRFSPSDPYMRAVVSGSSSSSSSRCGRRPFLHAVALQGVQQRHFW